MKRRRGFRVLCPQIVLDRARVQAARAREIVKETRRLTREKRDMPCAPRRPGLVA